MFTSSSTYKIFQLYYLHFAVADANNSAFSKNACILKFQICKKYHFVKIFKNKIGRVNENDSLFPVHEMIYGATAEIQGTTFQLFIYASINSAVIINAVLVNLISTL